MSNPSERIGREGGGENKKKKETILDLSRYLDKKIRVKFSGGREVSGMLKGYDPLLNLVLDSTVEFMREPDDLKGASSAPSLTETRALGLVVCRGTSVILILPQDGLEEIQNPFAQAANA